MTEHSRSRALIAAVGCFFGLGLMVIAWNIPLPLIAYSPGPVTDALDAVVVEGVPVHDSSGELLMLTVAGQDINAFEAMVAAFDPTVDVLARNLVRPPDESDEAYRRRNLEMMDQSTATAISVALQRLDIEEDPDVFVTGYAADTPAGEVLEIGDRIVSIDGRSVESIDAMSAIMAEQAPGDVLPIEVERDGEVLAYQVELVGQDEQPDRPMIGIFIRNLPFWIEIDAGIVGGPSAGMMYTLAIIDALTEDSLTHGHVVAGTGTIDAEGNVGNIGGVQQKVVASEAAGAEYMLVPEGNFEAASKAPAQDIEVIPVATIDEALAFLSDLGSE